MADLIGLFIMLGLWVVFVSGIVALYLAAVGYMKRTRYNE
jgi:hypothetical protein